jgi:hypothetical protein
MKVTTDTSRESQKKGLTGHFFRWISGKDILVRGLAVQRPEIWTGVGCCVAHMCVWIGGTVDAGWAMRTQVAMVRGLSLTLQLQD